MASFTVPLEPPCWKQVREQNENFGLRRPEDLYTPRCDKHGFYKPLQCPPFIECYCVDKYGNPTSQSSRGLFRPNCEKFGIIALTRDTKLLPTRSLKNQLTSLPATQPTSQTTSKPTTQPITAGKYAN